MRVTQNGVTVKKGKKTMKTILKSILKELIKKYLPLILNALCASICVTTAGCTIIGKADNVSNPHLSTPLNFK